MSAAAAPAPEAAAPAGGGKKKLIIIIVAVLLLVLIGGGAAFFLLKKKPAEGEEVDEHGDPKPKATAKAEKHEEAAAPPRPAFDPKKPPVFVPLDAFTVNLADRDADRYAQIAVTLEVAEAKVGEDLKLVMPAVRNNVLMLLSGKTAEQLSTREGKERLAQSIRFAALRPLGYDIEDEEEDEHAADGETPKKKKKKRKIPNNLPITEVHFSTFIVQ